MFPLKANSLVKFGSSAMEQNKSVYPETVKDRRKERHKDSQLTSDVTKDRDGFKDATSSREKGSLSS